MSEFEKPFDAKTREGEIYKRWEESGYFNPDNLPKPHTLNPKPFTIIMPPPNANGSLHAGHALFITLEDIITRFERMRGKKVLWLPGADHAGFETQIVYERKLEKEGRSRLGMDRKVLYDEIMAFTLENKKNMENQVRSLGASCDWSRETFTLDPEVIGKVQKTFVKMYDDGLIYRGKRIISWCSKHQTSLSDVETEFKERKDSFYYFQYGPFVISTARPETKFGDKYVVMHPSDTRYKKYKHGDTLTLEWINGPITATVIKDKAVDMKFGTGVMTITPWHDAVDFEIAERHDLPKEQVIDERGKLLPIAGEFAGMKIEEARPKIVEKLKAKGLLVKVDEQYEHSLRVCYKCERPIEPQIKDQWFVKMESLAQKAGDAVRAGKIRFIPERFKKIFLYWMDHTIDWNISRQIVWGIRIPAWFKEGEYKVSMESPGSGWEQDSDVFDTWFSSGQWPLITLGYPDGADFKTFYPTSVMETGYDLIFKWIPRMVIFGLYMAKKVPFEKIYLHGLVNDKDGKKMSKSKGNVINPLDFTSKYGTDALRMALVVGNSPGSDLALSEDKVRGYRNFTTKIWNMARFIEIQQTTYNLSRPAGSRLLDQNRNEAAGQLITANSSTSPRASKKPKFTTEDKKNIKEFESLKKTVTKHLEGFQFHLAAEQIYHYLWHTFADKIIEEAKERLKSGDEADQAAAYAMLLQIFSGSLKLLHPFMPFVTEEIYGRLPGHEEKMLIVEEW